jgi:FixJ family two-component response regulator
MKPPSTTHVYLVDDDRAMLESLAFVLNQAGLSCSSFSDPFDFLNTFQDDGLGCLILDLAMLECLGLKS